MPVPVLPAPQNVTISEGPGSPLRTEDRDALVASLSTWAPRAADLAARISVAAAETAPATPVEVATASDKTLPSEGYTLTLSPERWTLRARDEAGAFWAVQTLTQLVREGQVPVVEITDHPAYPVRGVMLDISRFFFGPRDIKAVIDLASAYKMNILHLHLTDDQGWRLEIETRPLLTELASGTDVGGGTGGFLTLAEYEDLQDYADARHVTIVPEIDLPGHTHAAQIAYPEISPDGEPREPYLGTKVGFSALHLTSDAAWSFVEDVVASVSKHTRGEYIHLGGDESLTLSDEDYRVYMQRLAEVGAKYGKKLTFWQEASVAELPAQTRLQFWNPQIETGHLAAVALAQDVTFIASPATRAYLDQKYTADFELGLDWARLTDIEDAYDWDPVAELPGIPAESIIGVEACLWAETLRSFDDITMLVLPRLPALASVAWGSPKDFPAFATALAQHGTWWAGEGLAFYRSEAISWA
ncbi:hexosaminidase [Sanguibacter gelidistatuariae]|uniref:beta-N-acetylhexosaminidase n=1 Tax=Sanguibacter gelidistatuariae TaxID=1814289 RepID=A0A1G6H0N6_9MICO|nr:family 20 glycosylhydrolase [Sanguibacter gelidistatuariae]SDB87822.1 hexosaminidase [Sanguibacter gelidistatuariae]